jgi:hypothetical protein
MGAARIPVDGAVRDAALGVPVGGWVVEVVRRAEHDAALRGPT